MKPPAIRRQRNVPAERRHREGRSQERGITMVLVAIAMIAIIAMAALSIDVVTLYLAKEEAQRVADSAALAAAKVISLSGITGAPNDSTNWALICGGPSSPASQAANAVGQQSTVGSIASIVSITYSAGGSAPSLTCAGFPFATGVNNPMVTAQVTRAGLPTFFSRIWGNTGNTVSASATAEVFNPSNSGNVGNVATGSITPVQPRCVKPWIVPNRDPLYAFPVGGNYCDQAGGGACQTLVNTSTGAITHPGISTGGSSTNGVIGETFWLEPNCIHTGGRCTPRNTKPQANYWNTAHQAWLELPPSLEYEPGEAPTTTPVAIPSSCNTGRPYEEAVAGCDQATVYQCGVQHSSAFPPNQVDLNENPSAGTNDTMNGVKCLIHQTSETDTTPDGQDVTNLTTYPFQILPGANDPLTKFGLASTTPITNSSSVVSLPIYDSDVDTIAGSGTSPVTIVGFLQVFINLVDPWGNVNVTVLNVAGCSNGTGTDPVGNPVGGSSPVPVRLITPQ